MKLYIHYASAAPAVARDAAEATLRGSGGTDDVTKFWYGVVVDPISGAAVITVDADDPPRSGGKAPVSDPPEWLAEMMAARPSA